MMPLPERPCTAGLPPTATRQGMPRRSRRRSLQPTAVWCRSGSCRPSRDSSPARAKVSRRLPSGGAEVSAKTSGAVCVGGDLVFRSEVLVACCHRLRGYLACVQPRLDALVCNVAIDKGVTLLESNRGRRLTGSWSNAHRACMKKGEQGGCED